MSNCLTQKDKIMRSSRLLLVPSLLSLFALSGPNPVIVSAHAQQAQPAAETAGDAQDVAAADAPEPLTEEELEILVARIALYPDELVALISAASLYPLQIIEAERFLEQRKTKPDLQPKADWDGSVVSLLNYPEIVKMMSDDLDWTQAFGDALVNQQEDVLIAIQQLRERAVAQGVIKTDDKVKVVKEEDNIIIQPASTEVIYVPQYEPEMLYVPTYVPAPITYYPDPYPYYYSPAAPFFAGFVTGSIFAAVVDWNDWGVWGGSRWGNDVNIDCNNCFNNRDFNGKININDVDWRNVDRNKINFDKTQIGKVDRKEVRNNLKADDRNKLKNKAQTRDRAANSSNRAAKAGKPVKDVRASTLEGLKAKPGDRKAKLPDKAGLPSSMPKPAAKPSARPADKAASRPTKDTVKRPASKPKPAAKRDTRPKNPSPVGKVSSGKKTQVQSKRGAKSMGGGAKARPQAGGGGGHKQVKRGGGGKRRR
jgi:hypothetical protein